MNFLNAIRRCEELTYENEALRKRVAELKQKLAEKSEELEAKYKKIGNLITDNGRLIKANACLADMANARRARRKYDDNGDYIPVKPKEQER